MDWIKTLYPFSVYTLVVVVVGALLLLSVWSVMVGAVVAFAGWSGILRISPILDFIQQYIPTTLHEYVSANLHTSFPLHGDTSREGIYVWHPHGILITSMAYHTFHKSIPRMKAACHWAYTLVPFVRELMDRYGFINATYSEMKEALQHGSVSVAAGGMREIWYAEPHTMKLNLARKKGIFRIALQTGKPLIPVLVYGENELFEHIPFDFNTWLFETTGWFLPIPTWESVQRWVALLQGHGSPVVSHIGEPVSCKQIEQPTEEDIAEVRETYIKALRELYAKTRPEGYAKDIEIL